MASCLKFVSASPSKLAGSTVTILVPGTTTLLLPTPPLTRALHISSLRRSISSDDGSLQG
ncbi:hypothetical protein M404DRAFT_1007376 [Pisolithus tinctorius Marx 270]|uniref:Uncharacterized protein n=1 Tax=Pisolithus tinctorius Marx 270 TaxID=870435 RepID=A0A0C3IEX0_PISTI|nr:hypothetical protein M404DRAFT_1007376 [Pisolithus tinctorius Marx 270]